MRGGWLVVGLLLGLVGAQDTGGFYIGPPSINRESDGQCIDNKGQGIPEGLLFTPGPDECQVCTCLMKMPVLCRTVLCAPPKNCLSLRVGDACCQWICDEWDTPRSGGNDIGLRLVASAITAVFSLALLFFLIYRLRQRKLRGRQNHLEAESYNSAVGEQEDCWSGGGDAQLSTFPSGWIKGTSFTRPFPPTYDEAMQSSSTGTDGAGGSSVGWSEADQEIPAPPYHTITQDPVIPVPYPVATMGRLVLPPAGFGDPSNRTLPAVLRRIRRGSGHRRPEDDGDGPEARRSVERNTGWNRPTDLALYNNESLGISEETDEISWRGGGASSHPDYQEPAGGQTSGTQRGVSPAAPQHQQEQRYSYLSQSDFQPGSPSGGGEAGRVLQTAV